MMKIRMFLIIGLLLMLFGCCTCGTQPYQMLPRNVYVRTSDYGTSVSFSTPYGQYISIDVDH